MGVEVLEEIGYEHLKEIPENMLEDIADQKESQYRKLLQTGHQIRLWGGTPKYYLDNEKETVYVVHYVDKTRLN